MFVFFNFLLPRFAIVNFSTMASNQLRSDASNGSFGYVWGYRPDHGPLLAAVLVMFATLWACQFLSDLTSLTTALSVSGWFFTRDKAK